MKKLLIFLTLLILAFCSSCISIKIHKGSPRKSFTYSQKQGSVSEASFNEKIPFTTYKSAILLPFEIDGKIRNYVFDTGSSEFAIQSDSLEGDITIVTGDSGIEVPFVIGKVDSIKLNNLYFNGINAAKGDFGPLTEMIDNFGGILGAPILQKANWLINYPEGYVQISNENLADDTFTTIPITRSYGLPYTIVNIEDEDYKALIDFGSSFTITIPHDSKLAKKLLAKYPFETKQRDGYVLGERRTEKYKVTTVPSVNLNGINFENVEIALIENGDGISLGVVFFKEYISYLNNSDKQMSIKKVN